MGVSYKSGSVFESVYGNKRAFEGMCFEWMGMWVCLSLCIEIRMALRGCVIKGWECSHIFKVMATDRNMGGFIRPYM